jgi:hypothetical protein
MIGEKETTEQQYIDPEEVDIELVDAFTAAEGGDIKGGEKDV